LKDHPVLLTPGADHGRLPDGGERGNGACNPYAPIVDPGLKARKNPASCLTRRTGTITLTESYLLADPAERNCRRTLMDSTDFLDLTNV
jgi:hypothetical protein